MYEDFLYPFWFTFFNSLGYEVILSDYTTKDQCHNKAIDTIPSDTACYPAKAVHGHIRDLKECTVDFIWYPCIQHGPKEFSRDNNYHCPMVISSYPELIKNNMQEVLGDTPFHAPFLPLADKNPLFRLLWKHWIFKLKKKDIAKAVDLAWEEQKTVKRLTVKRQRKLCLGSWQNKFRQSYWLVVHISFGLGINHGIPELITSLGMAVLTEDGVAPLAMKSSIYVL